MKILYGTAAVIGCLFMCHFGYTGEGKTDYSFKSEDLPVFVPWNRGKCNTVGLTVGANKTSATVLLCPFGAFFYAEKRRKIWKRNNLYEPSKYWGVIYKECQYHIIKYVMIDIGI